MTDETPGGGVWDQSGSRGWGKPLQLHWCSPTLPSTRYLHITWLRLRYLDSAKHFLSLPHHLISEVFD